MKGWIYLKKTRKSECLKKQKRGLHMSCRKCGEKAK